MTVPERAPPNLSSSLDDTKMLKVAREIAMDLHPIEKILEVHEVSDTEWVHMAGNPGFQRYLQKCLEEWNSAVNTGERIKLKSLAFVEEALPEFYARAHDPKENLPAKVELLKAISRLAGIGGNVEGVMAGERLSVTINLGADQQVRIQKDVTPWQHDEDRL